MPIVYEDFQQGESRVAGSYPSTRRAVLEESFAQTFEDNPIMSLMRFNELVADESTGPKLDAATARARIKDAGYENELKVNDGGITDAALRTLMDRKRMELRRADVFTRAHGGAAEFTERLGLSVLTTLADPVSAGLNFVPVVGQARYAAWLGRAAFAERIAIRAGVGAAEGTLGSAIAEVPTYISRQHEQADYTMADSLLNVALGGVTGAGLHTTVGSLGEGISFLRGRGNEQLPGGQLPGVDNRLVVNPIDPKATPAQKLAQLKVLTQENVPLVQSIVDDLNKSLPGTESKLNVKADAAILDKAARPSLLEKKPWHGVEHIRDSLRFKTVLDRFDQLPAIVDRLKEHGISVVKTDTGKLLKPDTWGWRIVSLDLRMPNGQLVEHYMPIRELENAKKAEGHTLFEKWRNRDVRKLTPAEVTEMHADRARSQELYRKAYETALARTGQRESAVRASLKSFSARARSVMSTHSSSGYTATSSRQTPSTLRATKPGVTTATSVPSRASQTSGVSTGGILAPEGRAAEGPDITAAERAAGASPEVREATLRAAVGQAVTGERIDIEPLLSGNGRFESTAGAPIEPELAAAYKHADEALETTEKDPLEAANESADLAIADAQLIADRLGIERADPELDAAEEGVKMAERWARAAEIASTCLLRGG